MEQYNCTLYNCKSLSKLQSYLYISDKIFFKKLNNDLNNSPENFYFSFTQKDTGRELFKCSNIINKLHKRLMKLFNIKIEPYIKSGIKRESHITNAKYHQNSKYFLLMDIKSFYPSMTKSLIKKHLILTYKQSSNVAEFISNLVTIQQAKADGKRALVTGSPLSQYFSYIINKKMYDELQEVSKKENIIFSVYVDDMSFSSKAKITYKFHTKAYSIIKKYGYTIHTENDKKVFRGNAGNKAKITGVKISKQGFRILSKHKENIQKIIKSESHIEKQKSLLGMINYAIQVNPKYSKYMNLLKKYKKI